jgi:hypothetical protein
MFEGFSANKAIDRIKKAWELYQKDILNFSLLQFVGMLVSGVSFGILAGPIGVGTLKGSRRLMKGGKADVSDAFSGFSKFLPSFLLTLLCGLMIGLVYLVLMGLISLVTMLQLKAGAAMGSLAFIAQLIGFLVSAALGLACGVGILVFSVILSLGLIFIAEEDMACMPAFRKALDWLKANQVQALEYLLGNLLISLISVIPVVGSIAVAGFLNLNALQVYDAEKEAGRL